MKVTLPWPPSINHYWRIFRNRTILSRAGRQYRDDALAAVLSKHGCLTPLASRCRVAIVLYPPDRRIIDIDNRLKSTLDALKHCRVIVDDSLIDELTIKRGAISKDFPRAEIVVEAKEGAA